MDFGGSVLGSLGHFEARETGRLSTLPTKSEDGRLTKILNSVTLLAPL